ncbi:hypothetical protein C4580_01770 [Candidatus Woesearchaeota archaeon]|nr:MAG: hypothetical protein C4580_01770 [Candidatus Woesearchaeota archaeon]
MGDTTRKKRADIFKDIVDSLRNGSQTILQISKATDINWETVKNCLETLKTLSIIQEEEKNGKTFYFVDESKLIQTEENTLLGLPLTEDRKNATYGLFKRIIERWEKIRPDRKINKTFLHKILVKVVKNNDKDLKFPHGWYLFGECAVLQCDPMDCKEQPYQIGTEYDAKIDVVVTEYSQLSSTHELMQRQYTDEGNELYTLRLKISDKLLNKFTETSVHELKRSLKDFVFSFKKNEENEELLEYLNGFLSIVTRLINGLKLGELDDIRPVINETFMSIWELLATYNLYKSLVERGYYEKATIRKYYTLRMGNLKHIAESYLSALHDYCPPLLIPQEDPLRKLITPQAS